MSFCVLSKGGALHKCLSILVSSSVAVSFSQVESLFHLSVMMSAVRSPPSSTRFMSAPISHPLPANSNTNNSDYDLSYNLRVKVPAGDAAKSAFVVSGANTVFVITNTLVTRGNSSAASVAGRVRNLGTAKAANSDNALDVIKAMFANPSAYAVKVTSTKAPDGLATGKLSKWSVVDFLKNMGKNAADRSHEAAKGRH